MEEYEKLRQTGDIPQGEVYPVAGSKENLTRYSDYAGEPVQYLVIDGATWYMPQYKNRPDGPALFAVWSGDGKGNIGTYQLKSNQFIKSVFDGKIQVKDVEYLTEKQRVYNKKPPIRKEDDIMANEKPQDVKSQLDDLARKAEAKAAATPMELEKEAKTKEDKAKREQERAAAAQEAKAFQGKLAAITEGVSQTVPSHVTAYNRKHGRLLGYITGTSSKVAFSIAKTSTAKTNDVTAPVTGENVEYAIRVSESRPSKPKAVIYTIPAKTFEELSVILNNSEEYSLDKLVEDEKAPIMVTQVDSHEVAFQIFTLYFGTEIKESEEVWAAANHAGEQGVVVTGYKNIVSKRDSTTSFRPFMQARRDSGISSLLTAWNYLPMKTYDTIALGAGRSVDAESLQHLIDTVYEPLRAKGGKDGEKDSNTTKFDRLTPECKNLIQVSGDKVSIDYFKPDSEAFQQLLNIRPFWASRTSDHRLAENGVINLAYKVWVTPKEPSKPKKLVYSTVSILDENGGKIFDEYATFVNVVGRDNLKLDTLRRFARRSAPRKASTNTISGAAAQKIAMGTLHNSLRLEGKGKITVEGANYNLQEELSGVIRNSRSAVLERVTV